MLPQAAMLPGTSGLFKKKSQLQEKFCPRQRSCLGQVACSNNKPVLRNNSAPSSEAARDKRFVHKNSCLETFLPQAAKLPGTSGLFIKKIIRFFRNNSAPGSGAARDKRLVQNNRPLFEKSSAAGSEAAWDKWLVRKKNRFLRKVLPQAAKLPGTSGLFKKK